MGLHYIIGEVFKTVLILILIMIVLTLAVSCLKPINQPRNKICIYLFNIWETRVRITTHALEALWATAPAPQGLLCGGTWVRGSHFGSPFLGGEGGVPTN